MSSSQLTGSTPAITGHAGFFTVIFLAATNCRTIQPNSDLSFSTNLAQYSMGHSLTGQVGPACRSTSGWRGGELPLLDNSRAAWVVGWHCSTGLRYLARSAVALGRSGRRKGLP